MAEFDSAKTDEDTSARKAYRRSEFINSPAARPIRILAEFLEPQGRLKKYNIEDTIVFFGSARIMSKESAVELRGRAKTKKEIERAELGVEMSRYYTEAVDLAQRMTEWSKSLGRGKRRFIVCSGGGPGIMEAANRGASLAGGLSIGFNISLPFEQFANPFITQELNFEFHYFFIRKYWFAYLAKALVIFPGGFGTMDELFEILTLIQTEKIRKRVPIVLYGPDYWNEVLNLKAMVKWGTISEADLSLFRICKTPKEAFEYLSTELKNQYLK